MGIKRTPRLMVEAVQHDSRVLPVNSIHAGIAILADTLLGGIVWQKGKPLSDASNAHHMFDCLASPCNAHLWCVQPIPRISACIPMSQTRISHLANRLADSQHGVNCRHLPVDFLGWLLRTLTTRAARGMATIWESPAIGPFPSQISHKYYLNGPWRPCPRHWNLEDQSPITVLTR